MLIQPSKLRGVNPMLAAVIEAVGERIDVMVLEGMRTAARQAQLVKAGASRTLKSAHLTGNAVDLGAVVGNEVRWDWPLYFDIAEVVQAEAKRLAALVVWGGCWSLLNQDASPEDLQDEYVERCRAEKKKPFLDGPHFELKDGINFV